MKAMHFGAGNIGRGFIGYLLHKSDYEITFVDINENLIKDINEFKEYTVMTLCDNPQKEKVNNINAINLNNKEELKKAILDVDLITTSIGVNNLKSVGVLLSELLSERIKVNLKPCDIIACENALFATNILKQSILDNSSDELKSCLKDIIGFPNCTVDRIVPNTKIKKELAIDVAVEDFFEWDIEAKNIKINKKIQGVDYVEDLEPYLERKLFLLNGAHATIAYCGYLKNYKFIHEAIKDSEIKNIIIRFHKECTKALSIKHSIDIEVLTTYSNKLIKRFENIYLQDENYRVGRDPIRKLSFNDRLICPLRLCNELNIDIDGILCGIAAGFKFNYIDDANSQKIQNYIKTYGITNAVTNFTGLKDEIYSHLVNEIVRKYADMGL